MGDMGQMTLEEMTRLRLQHVVALQVVVLTVLTYYQLSRIKECVQLDEDQQVMYGAHPNEWSDVHQVTPPFLQSFDNTFGACLIIQDDNHLLVEWLAYHYHVLPMRRLIVAVDPRSMTSPSEILDRYRKMGLMKITEWQEEDFMPPDQLALHNHIPQDNEEKLTKLYIERQIFFYARCMAVLRHEGIGWTALIDTDEYILPNPRAKLPLTQNSTKKQTIHDLIVANQRNSFMAKYGCISMHRLLFGSKESDKAAVQNMVPPGYDGSDFSTLRWRYHAPLTDMDSNGLSKCMVNLKRTVDVDFRSIMVNPHRPVKRICRVKDMRIEAIESPFAAYHYTGSWEQWSFRDDFRSKRRRESFDKLYFENDQDDTIRPWLREFVDQQGKELSSYLLKGAGRVETK